MGDPVVSVITPTYNRCSTLSRAIESVLEQTYKDFEYLLIDDGSVDGTADLVEEYADERLEYIEFDENRGANAARNRGINEADGEIIAFLDSDDAFPPENLSEKVEAFKSLPPSYGGIVTQSVTYEGGKLREHVKPPEHITYEQLLDQNCVGGFSSVAFWAEVFKNVGLLDESIPASQDYEFFLRLLSEYNLRGVSSTEVKRHLQPDSITLSLERKAEAFDLLLEKHDDISEERIARQSCYLGMLYCREGNARSASRQFYRAIQTEPRLIRSYPLFVMSVCSGPLLPNVASLAYKIREIRARV